jgi:acyl-[acyl-carrier-protein] desaturase
MAHTTLPAVLIRSAVVSPSLIEQIKGERPSFAPSLLNRTEKDRLIQRGFHGLYRWYTDRSQRLRNWNPDCSFDWSVFGQHHSPELIAIVEGFYAVEQYAPDYTAELTRLTRKDYGRANFALRWGSEEEKHSDLWRNVLLASRRRTPEQIERYTDDLRAEAWTAPDEDPLRMLLYTVFQERATQLNYMNLAKVARGESDRPQFAGDADPVLVAACRAIAMDEAAHYEFFLEGARLFLYYYPEETLTALVDVLRNFTMPASRIVPDYDTFIRTLYEGAIFGPGMYAREVVPVALASLGIDSIRGVERGIKHTRLVPDVEGEMRDTAIFRVTDGVDVVGGGVDLSIVEAAVSRLFDRIDRYEREVGLAPFASEDVSLATV